MDKKIQRILNIIMSCFVGVFIGSGLYRYWHFRKYPELYFIQSAPWYTSIIVQGLLTLILLAICILLQRKKVIKSMDKAGCPYEHAPMERFGNCPGSPVPCRLCIIFLTIALCFQCSQGGKEKCLFHPLP